LRQKVVIIIVVVVVYYTMAGWLAGNSNQQITNSIIKTRAT
jgi:hypothetical protein